MQSLKQPTNEQVEAAIAIVQSPHHAEYFFDRLENPFWIIPLKERGFFSNPPDVVKDGDSLLAYRWPESQYLVRMAALAPKEVADILAGLKTDNWRILHDILRAAKAMPAEFGAALVPVIAEASGREVVFYGLHDIAELIEHLAKDGQPDPAVDLMRRTMKIHWFDRNNSRQREDGHWYIEGLTSQVVPALAPLRPRELIGHLSAEMRASINADKHQTANFDDDSSYAWRAAIEEDEQNSDYDTQARLVGCLRDGYEQAIRAGSLSLDDALAMLAEEKCLIFKRMTIHLIRVFADQNETLARNTVLDQRLFDDYRVKHEYGILVRDRFTLLTVDQRNTWLEWVDQGPKDSTGDALGLNAQQIDYWRFEKLWLVREQLDPQRAPFVDKMLQQHGEPELALYLSYSRSGFMVDQSPLSLDELRQLSFDEAVERVTRWEPPPGHRFERPTLEGLRRTFNQYIATDPALFAAHAGLLKEKPAPFVRAFLEAILQGVKETKQIDLDAVLALCQWAVGQPLHERTWPLDEDWSSYDADWQWTWNVIAELCQAICHANPSIERRETLWGLIEPLLEGDAESNIFVDWDAADIRLIDFATHFINSSQGKAMEAVMRYARWVGNHVAVQRDGAKTVEGGFTKLPEVQHVLEAKLVPDAASFSSRAVYGWELNLLYWIDSKWLARHIDAIFNLRQIESAPREAYGWAAWNCFLMAHRVNSEFYRLLRPQFSYAVDEARHANTIGSSRFEPFRRLGEHLMVLYGRGQIELESDERLIGRFIENTPGSLRSAAIESVGHILEASDSVPADVIDRFKILWEWYWPLFGAADAKADPDSSVFGAWFVSESFDDAWALERLEHFTEIVSKPGPEHRIMERLAQIAATDVGRSTRILSHMINGDKEGWRIYGWRNDAMKILQLALAAGGDSRLLAEQIIDRLGRRGFADFGELLKLQV